MTDTTILGFPVDINEGWQFIIIWAIVTGALIIIAVESPKLAMSFALAIFFTAALMSRIV